jgi:hypothetical protein
VLMAPTRMCKYDGSHAKCTETPMFNCRTDKKTRTRRKRVRVSHSLASRASKRHSKTANRHCDRLMCGLLLFHVVQRAADDRRGRCSRAPSDDTRCGSKKTYQIENSRDSSEGTRQSMFGGHASATS